MANTRRPRNGQAPRNPAAWGPPSSSVVNMARNSGTNRAMAEFYKALTLHEWDVQNDYRGNTLSNQQYQAQHQIAMDEMDHRTALHDYGASAILNPDMAGGEAGVAGTSAAGDPIAKLLLAIAGGSSTGMSAFDSLDKNTPGIYKNPDPNPTGAVLGKGAGPSGSVSAGASAQGDMSGHIQAPAPPDGYSGDSAWDRLNHAADTFNTGIGHGIEAATNKVTGGHAGDIGHAAVGAGMYAIDKLSRPVYGANNALKYIDNQDQEGGSIVGGKNPLPALLAALSPGPVGLLTSGVLHGQSPLESIDDLNAGDIGGTASAFWDGLKGKDKTLGMDIIKANADRNPDQNVYDTKAGQIGLGLAGDIVTDPLSYVGVGFVKNVATKPAALARQLRGAEDAAQSLRSISEETASFGIRKPDLSPTGPYLKDGLSASETYTPDEIYSMLGGHYRPTSEADRVASIKHTGRNLHFINKQLDNLAPDATKVAKVQRKLGKVEALGQRLAAEREAKLSEFEGESAVDLLRRELEIDVSTGKAPASALEELDQSLANGEVAHAISKHRIREWKLSTGKALDETDKTFEEVLGSKWSNDYRFSPEDRKMLHDASYKLAKEQDPKFAELERTARVLKNHQTRNADLAKDATKSKDFESAKKYTAEATRYKKRLDLVNAEKDQIQASIFIRSAQALVKNRIGETVWKDTNAATQLKSLRTRAAKEIEAINSGQQTNVSYASAKELDAADAALQGTEGDLLIPHNGEFDRLSHLTSVVKGIDSKLKDLKSNVTPASNELLHPPASLLNPETGELDYQRLSENLKFHDGEFIHRPTGDPETDHWLESASKSITQEYQSRVVRATDAAQRVNNAGTQAARNISELRTLATNGDSRAQEVLSMFDTHKGKQGLFPFIEKNGKKEFFVSQVGREDEDAKFLKEFKRIHNISLDEAFVMRDKALGRVVKMDVGTQWHHDFPEGLTQKEFADKALGSLEDFKLAVLHGPVKIDMKGLAEGGLDIESHAALMRRLKNEHASPKEIGAASEKWAENVHGILTAHPEAGRKLLNKRWENTRFAQSKASGASKADAAKQPLTRKDLTKPELDAIKLDARNEAVRNFENKVKNNTLHAPKYDETLPLAAPVGEHSSYDQLVIALKNKYGAEEANLRLEKTMAQRNKELDKVKEIDVRINQAKADWKTQQSKLEKVKGQASKSKVVMARRLNEETIFKLIDAQKVNQGRALTLNVMGHDFLSIPGSQAMFKAAEFAGDLPVIKQTRQVFANVLASPASTLPSEMALANSRRIANTAEVISMHVKNIDHTLGQVPINQREAAFEGFLGGAPVGSPELNTMLNDHFEEMLPYFNGKVKVGDTHLTRADINEFMPQEFWINNHAIEHDVKTGKQLAKMLLHGKSKIKNSDPNLYKDPIRTVWVTRVAIEQAMAKKGLLETINKTFGVKRVSAQVDKNLSHTVEKLGKLGWEQIDELGSTHYFAPEVVHDVRRLLKMMEPRNITKVGRQIDDVTGYWKTLSTIYNPGYYTRNGVGEIMSGWLGGVENPKYYRQALKWVRYARHDGKELEAIRSHTPALDHVPTNSELGSQKVVRLGNGQQLSLERVHVLYHDQGLRTGFISTEFKSHFGNKANLAKRVPGVQKAANANMAFRGAGESFEDYFRVAHFMHSLEHAPKNLGEQGAAEYAAQQVRKYHFDYQDFTKAEKMIMMRAFPFYKWTRKALPLMSTMLFQKPGKMLIYPKAMNAVSDATVGTGDMTDTNGFMPNYQGIIPGWMQDLWSYQVMGDPSNQMGSGNQTFFNMVTPQMDSLKMLNDPAGTAWMMTNPVFKAPFELAQGKTSGKMGFPMDGPTDKLHYLARTTPEGSFGDKLSRGKVDGQALAGFLTGLGFYQNNDNRRQGEMMGGK